MASPYKTNPCFVQHPEDAVQQTNTPPSTPLPEPGLGYPGHSSIEEWAVVNGLVQWNHCNARRQACGHWLNATSKKTSGPILCLI